MAIMDLFIGLYLGVIVTIIVFITSKYFFRLLIRTSLIMNWNWDNYLFDILEEIKLEKWGKRKNQD